MAPTELTPYLDLAHAVTRLPAGARTGFWSAYDAAADVLYITFRKPAHATDSELTDDDIIIRYDGDQVIGITVLHASERSPDTA